MKRYRVKEVFKTIQGEGMRAGTSAVFIRFVGCNLWAGTPATREKGIGACASWCDTDFTKQGSLEYTATELVQTARSAWGPDGVKHRWVVLTGGEPMLQVDRTLVNLLRDYGFKVAIETNGTVDPPCLVDWLCCSPKLKVDGDMPDLKIGGADELKVVLGGEPDWTDAQLHRLEFWGNWQNLIVNPLDARAQVMHEIGPTYDGYQLPLVHPALERCVEFVRENPAWRLGYQLHKVAGVP